MSVLSPIGKINVNTDRVSFAALVSDTADAVTFDSTATELSKSVVSFGYQPTMQTNDFWASGQQIDTYVAKSGGTVNLTVPVTEAILEKLLFGSQYDVASKMITSNKDDVIPYVMLSVSTKRSDGTVNLYKFPKVKFASQGESVQTSNASGVTYSSVQLNGNYSPLINNGDDMYVIKGLDVSTVEGQEIYDEWFDASLPS
ncbi:MAG: phage tail protein [Oscillospiraceae bacterium]|jgi:phi13 family phage major tail protein|nr:phage tail protein [Oscillospiraceae bacterium]